MRNLLTGLNLEGFFSYTISHCCVHLISAEFFQNYLFVFEEVSNVRN
jgi:hypothetical protein